MIRLLLAGIIVFTVPYSSLVSSSSNQWIIGTWELYHDPDGDEKDWIEFNESGEVVSFTHNNSSQIKGTYQVEPDEIRIVYEYFGQSIPIVLTYKQNKAALYAFSNRTGNTSTYKKMP